MDKSDSSIVASCCAVESGRAGYEYLEGRFTRDDAKVAINLSGGLKSKGHPVGATGASMHALIHKQLIGAGLFAGTASSEAQQKALALVKAIHPVGVKIVGEFMLRGIRNVRCVGIAPGYTATPMLTGMNQDALNAILKDVHLGRLVEPEEIARMIGHCAENEAINATTIEVTGGLCYPGAIAK